MYFDIKRMRAKDCWLLTGRGLLWSRLLAEVKREGFYEAVTADKVSLSPPQTGLFRYCTQVAVRQCTYTVALSYFLLVACCDFAMLYLKPFTRPFSPFFFFFFFFCLQLVLSKVSLRSYLGLLALSTTLPGFPGFFEPVHVLHIPNTGICKLGDPKKKDRIKRSRGPFQIVTRYNKTFYLVDSTISSILLFPISFYKDVRVIGGRFVSYRSLNFLK